MDLTARRATRLASGQLRSSPITAIVEDDNKTAKQAEQIQHLEASIEALREDGRDDVAALAERRDLERGQTKQDRKRRQQKTFELEVRIQEREAAISQLTGLAERLGWKVAETRRRRQRMEAIRQYEEAITEHSRDAERSTAEAARYRKEVELLWQEQREEEDGAEVDEGEGFAVVDSTSAEPAPS